MTFGQKALIGSGIPLILLGGFFLLSSGTPGVVFEQIMRFFEDDPVQELVSEQKAKPVSLIFVGDIMLDRYIRTVSGRQGEEFLLDEPLQAWLRGGERVIGNLEGPITNGQSFSETSRIGEANNYRFTFPETSGQFLRQVNIGIVNLGNNHILNFDSEGVDQTKYFLDEAGVRYFGSPLPQDGRIWIEEIQGTKIAFVNYNEFIGKGQEKAFEDIREAKQKAELVILYTHWGTEYVGIQERTQKLAHEFIEAGADLIIGSHPHVIQEREEYQGKKIYYSLGNFIFDQYFSPETKRGLIVKATFDPSTEAFVFEEKEVSLLPSGKTMLAP